MKKFAFFVVGLPHSGKELTANLLSHFLNLPKAASSSIVYDALASRRGVQRWELEASPKVEITPDLEQMGNVMCEIDPAALVAPLLRRGVRIIDGIRRRVELCAARAEAIQLGLYPVVVWLDRHGGEFDNTEVTRGDADYIINNHGSVGRLTELVCELASEFALPEAGFHIGDRGCPPPRGPDTGNDSDLPDGFGV
jgi:hypothetical protein